MKHTDNWYRFTDHGNNNNTDIFLSFSCAQHTINQAITLPHSNQKWLPPPETQLLGELCNVEESAGEDRSLKEAELGREDTASPPSQYIFLL